MRTLTAAERVLRVLTPEYGGERKFNVVAAMLRSEKIARNTLVRLERAGLARHRHCYEGGRWGLTKAGLVAGRKLVRD